MSSFLRCFISFYPEVLLACGSPIGTFLALRQSTLDKEKLFKFNTTKRFFNLFHVREKEKERVFAWIASCTPLLERMGCLFFFPSTRNGLLLCDR